MSVPQAARHLPFGDVLPRARVLLLTAISIIGYLLCADGFLLHGVYGVGVGAGAGDVFAYWTAGRHVIDGGTVYGPGVGGYAAYLYPPPLAQAFALVGWLPFSVVVWGWRALEALCLLAAVGSLRNVGLVLALWPPVIAELDAGNVHLVIAAAVAMAIRGDARFILPVALTKYASLAAVPAAVVANRRGLLVGAAAAAAIVALSFALSPQLWRDYLRFLGSVPSTDSGWYNLGAHVPLPLRIALAGILAFASIRWVRLSAVATTLALPVLWFHSLSTLVAVVARPAMAVPPGDAGASR